uniref:NAD-dependent epimerase/dehydratase family protein n=1 Tax=Leucobacter sp. BZR 635 TaxID=3378705 RepID=UPI003A8BC4D6
MRALVLGGTGAVGSAAVAALRARGHEALAGSRSATSPGSVQLDLTTSAGRTRMVEVARECDAVIDASGREDP